MKLNRKNFEIARARACVSVKDLEAAGIPRGTLSGAIRGKRLRPETLGKIAKALGVDATEIMETEN